jgi:hypothetical protein
MRLQAFSPALAFTSTALRTPPNNNNKVASVSTPTSSQRQGFEATHFYTPEEVRFFSIHNPPRLAEMEQEITFFLECFEADWFKTFLSNRDPKPATEALHAKLSASQSSLSKNFKRSRSLISTAWQFFHGELENKDRATKEIEKDQKLLEFYISRGGSLDFNLEKRKVYFQELLQQVQKQIQQLQI